MEKITGLRSGIEMIKKDEVNQIQKIEEYLHFYILSHYKEIESINIVCVGCDKSIGSSLGPIIGTRLLSELESRDRVKIFGTLKEPIPATGIDKVLDKLESDKDFIITIDTSLGASDEIGSVIIESSSLFPSIKLGKNLISKGDINIKGIVGDKEKISCLGTFGEIGLNTAWELSEVIEISMKNVLKRLFSEERNTVLH